jgi:hypothetical protein
VAGAAPSWAVFAVAVIALSLDGIDGWLARRQGYVSDFGARFDMEVDSVLALVLALSAAVSSGLGPLAILLGLPRYAFAVGGMGPALDAPRPARPVQPQGRLRGAARRADRAAGCRSCRRALPWRSWPLAALALAWSFAVDVDMAVAAAGMTPGRGRWPADRLQIGARAILRLGWPLVLHLVLIQPNHPAAMTWGALFVFPLELPVILLALIALPLGTAGRGSLRGRAGGGAGPDRGAEGGGLRDVHGAGRGFNPVADLALIEAGLRLATGAIGLS